MNVSKLSKSKIYITKSCIKADNIEHRKGL